MTGQWKEKKKGFVWKRPIQIVYLQKNINFPFSIIKLWNSMKVDFFILMYNYENKVKQQQHSSPTRCLCFYQTKLEKTAENLQTLIQIQMTQILALSRLEGFIQEFVCGVRNISENYASISAWYSVLKKNKNKFYNVSQSNWEIIQPNQYKGGTVIRNFN